MMIRSRNVGDIFMTVALLALGLSFIYGAQINPEFGKGIISELGRPWVATWVGVVLVFSVLLCWAGGAKKGNDKYINFDSTDGSVGISTKAICDFINRIGKEFPAVKSMDSKLVKKKDSLDISLSVKAVAGNKIPELSQVLQQRVREEVRESLGLDNIQNVTIRVQEIVGSPKVSTPQESIQKTRVSKDLELPEPMVSQPKVQESQKPAEKTKK